MSCETGREKEREEKYYFNEKGSKIIFFFFFFCLALMNSAHLSIDVHCSNGAKKNRFSSTARAYFLVFEEPKNTNIAPLL